MRGSTIHIANERSDTVASFEVDAVNGIPNTQFATVELPSPACMIELPVAFGYRTRELLLSRA